jgi:ATP-dependent exoDNAse (exonuclease V) alpha subunit
MENERFCKVGNPYYANLNFTQKNIPNGTMGTIMRLRKRYENTPNFYTLYVVKFDGFEYNDELIDQYDSNGLAKLSTN